MSVLAAIAARLLADPAFAGSQGGRVGTTRRFKALPATCLQTISSTRGEHYKGPLLRGDSVQVDIWSPVEAQGASLRDRAIEILHPAASAGGFSFRRARVLNIRSGPELGQGPQEAPAANRLAAELHRESIDIFFTYTPA